MKYLLYLLSLSIPLFYSIMLEECNTCNEWIKPQTNMYDVSYRLCIYDTSFDVTYTKQPEEQLDWLFLGTTIIFCSQGQTKQVILHQFSKQRQQRFDSSRQSNPR